MAIGTTLVPESLQRIANFCWPRTVSEEGIVNRDALVRRLETIMVSLLPAMGSTYAILKCCCDCENSFILSICSWTVLPSVFYSYEEWSAESAARIIREKLKPPEQVPPLSSTLQMNFQEAARRKETEELYRMEESPALRVDITAEPRAHSPAAPPRSPNNRPRKAPIKTPSGVARENHHKPSPT